MNSAKGALVLPRLIQIVEQSSPDSVQDLTTQERYAGIKKGIEQIWWCSPDTPEAAGHGREAPETLHEERQWSHSHSAIHAWEDKWRRICMNQSLRAREWLEKAKVKTIHTQTNKVKTENHHRITLKAIAWWIRLLAIICHIHHCCRIIILLYSHRQKVCCPRSICSLN